MSPTARSELRAYVKRVRKESKKRDKQFRAPWMKVPDTGFIVGIVLGMVAVWLLAVWRWV